MASSSPFGCNPKKSVFGAKPVLDKQAAPEPVVLLVDKSQVITAMIPYNSKNAPLVRAHMHEHIQHEGRKVFIFRAANGWTNIGLDSTAENPKLTCEPITTLKTAWAAFAACPHVGKLTIRWKGEDKELKYEDIDGMEGMFDPLPEGTPDSSGPSMDKKTDAEYLMDKLIVIEKKVEALDIKYAHLVDMMERFTKNDEGGQIIPTTPVTTSKEGVKRKQRGESSN